MTNVKPRALLLASSLGVNAVLLGALALRPQATSEYFRTWFRTGATTPDRNRVETTTHPPAEKAAGGATAVAWDEIPTGDFHALAARLQAAGFPRHVIRAAVTAAISRHFATKRLAVAPLAKPVEYWRNPAPDRALDPSARAALRDLARAQQKILRDVLGADDVTRDENEAQRSAHERAWGSLAPEKIVRLQQINDDYNELSARIREESLGFTLPEDRAKLDLLEREKRADLARLLTPDELADYDFRQHPSAHRVRGFIGQFEATEAEFRALYAVQRAFDEKYDRPYPLPPALAGERDLAERQLMADLNAAIGPERAGALAQSRPSSSVDRNLEAVQRLARRLDLPPSTGEQVVAVQGEILKRAAAVRKDSTLTAESRTIALRQLQTEATSRLAAVFGERGLAAYRENGGTWLANLTPRN